MKIRCHITKKDVREAYNDWENGQTTVSTSCPVSRSINRKLEEGFRGTTGPSFFTIWSLNSGARLESIELPPAIKELVETFDLHKVRIKPTNFMMEFPSFYLKKETK